MSDAAKGILQGLKNIGEINQNFKKINIHDIDIKNNVRSEYNIDELAENIKVQGVQVPIKVIKNNNNRYDILFGHRRYLANKKCYEDENNEKFLYIPAIIDTPKTEEEIIEIQVVENLDREDLTDIEKSEAIFKYKEITGKTNSQIAKRFGKKEKWIRDILDAKLIINKINETKESLLTTKKNNIDSDSNINESSFKELKNIPTSVIVETKGLNPIDQKEILVEVKDKNLTQAEVRKVKKKIKNDISKDAQSAIKEVKKEKKEKKRTKNSNVTNDTEKNIADNNVKITIGEKKYTIKKRKLDKKLIDNLKFDEDIKNIVSDLFEQINT